MRFVRSSHSITLHILATYMHSRGSPCVLCYGVLRSPPPQFHQPHSFQILHLRFLFFAVRGAYDVPPHRHRTTRTRFGDMLYPKNTKCNQRECLCPPDNPRLTVCPPQQPKRETNSLQSYASGTPKKCVRACEADGRLRVRYIPYTQHNTHASAHLNSVACRVSTRIYTYI